jgi:L-histidine N-alpha-methyltransferase
MYKNATIGKKCKCLLSSYTTNESDIITGLFKKPKHIPSRFFYDQRGSALFDRICQLSEYYVTRTETCILERVVPLMRNMLADVDCIVELGSGMSKKTRLILDALGKRPARYIPIDVSQTIMDVARNLCQRYDNLSVTGIVDTYEAGLEHVKNMNVGKKLVLFLGSSIGNFEKKDATKFLSAIRLSMENKDMLLIGIDLVKQKSTLEKAYNDSLGITAEFNLNMLRRINAELGGQFILDDFEHVAVYNQKKRRIEMYLKSKRNHDVSIGDKIVSFGKGELVCTEYSHKYSKHDFAKMLHKAKFKTKNIWTDENQYFAVILAEAEK